MDCSPPGSSVYGISQARILEWVVISFFKGSSQPREWTRLSCIGRRILYHWATWEVKFILFSELFCMFNKYSLYLNITDTDRVPTPPHAPTLHQPLTATFLFPISLVWPFQECHINEIIQCASRSVVVILSFINLWLVVHLGLVLAIFPRAKRGVRSMVVPWACGWNDGMKAGCCILFLLEIIPVWCPWLGDTREAPRRSRSSCSKTVMTRNLKR